MPNTYLQNLLGENETILFSTRQHWLVLASEILSESILAIAWTVLITLLQFVLPPNPFLPLAYLLLILPLVSLWRDVLIWRNRQYLVTNWRVIQIAGVLNKEVTDSSLEKVNDVKLEQSAWGRIFDYGNVEILTASELGVNKFKQVGRPIQLKTAMLNAKEKLEQGRANGSKTTTSGIPELIAQLDSLRQHGVLSDAEFQQKKAQLLAKL